MSTRFKIGDWVRCYDPSPLWKFKCEKHGLDPHGEYEVIEISKNATRIRVDGADDWGISLSRWALSTPKIKLTKGDCM